MCIRAQHKLEATGFSSIDDSASTGTISGANKRSGKHSGEREWEANTLTVSTGKHGVSAGASPNRATHSRVNTRSSPQLLQYS